MALINTKTGCVAVGIIGGDIIFSEVGENLIPKLTFSMLVGKDDAGKSIWFNCKAWRDVAKHGNSLNIEKKDRVFVFGEWERNEYNGKIYHNLVIEWVEKMGVNSVSSKAIQSAVAEISDDVNDDDLPF